MTKYAILNDTHFGAANNSEIHDKYIKLFYDTIFFPYLKENNIKNILHLGDVFDKRENINFQILNSCKEYFFDVLVKRKINLVALCGNHDSFFRNTIEVNSLRLLLKEYKNITVIDSPQEFSGILLMPWICEDNYEESMRLIKTTKSQYCFGHFEIAGFKMYKNNVAREGMDRDIFKKFKLVLSGHYHHKSKIGNIEYLGSQYQLTWNDYGDKKYFHVFDTDTGELEAIENPHQLFVKVDPFTANTLDPKDKIVRLVINDDVSKKQIEAVIEHINQGSPHKIQVQDNSVYTNSEEITINNDVDLEDTLSVISGFIDKADTPNNIKIDNLKQLMSVLLAETKNND